MRILIYTFHLFLILFACNGQTKSGISQSNEIRHDTIEDLNKNNNSSDNISPPISKPILITFLDSLQKQNFFPDIRSALRLGHYTPNASKQGVVAFENYKYFQMDSTSSSVYQYFNGYSIRPHWLDSTRRSILEPIINSSDSIHGAYFIDTTLTKFKTDGFIEEWAFGTEEKARLFYDALNFKPKNITPTIEFIYFNHYYSSIHSQNQVYIIHSRATWDVKRLDSIAALLSRLVKIKPPATNSGQMKK